MSLYFLSLASGSSGNCYYLGTDFYGILIDAGIGGRTIKKGLKEKGIALDRIRAVFLTHDHYDHIKGCASLGEKYKIPVYATSIIHDAIDQNKKFPDKLSTCKRYLNKEEPMSVGDLKICAFEVSHDGTDNVGYCIEAFGIRITFATDLGYISDTAARYLSSSHYMILEANYDEEMLQNGRYPYYLKERIRGEKGHLCNTQAAEFVASSYHPEMKRVWLCHLSRDNNHPELAKKTVEKALLERGIYPGRDIEIESLKRNSPGNIYQLLELI